MEFVTYEAEGQIGLITISRPKALNALNSAVLGELDEVLDAVDLEEIRALILTGAGEKSFVAGADIDEFSYKSGGRGFWEERKRCIPEAGKISDPGNRGCQWLCAGRRMRDRYELRYPYLFGERYVRTA